MEMEIYIYIYIWGIAVIQINAITFNQFYTFDMLIFIVVNYLVYSLDYFRL